MPTVDLPLGPIDYRVFGPDTPEAPTAVFVHGFLVNGTLWDSVAEQLAQAGIRSIVPDWPLGAHRTPARADADLSPVSVAQAVLDLLDALDLSDVTLVGSDTGGGLCQLAVQGDHHRVSALVLTNCDAFEKFPPAYFVPLFKMAQFRAAVWMVAQNTRLRAVRHSPLAFGPLLSAPRSATLTRGWMQPVLDDGAIRHDITRFARAMSGKELVDSAEWLAHFDKPTRLVWGTRDRHFNLDLARRLVAVLPQAQLQEVEGARTFVSIDRPDAVTQAIVDAVGQSRIVTSGTD